MKMLGKMGLRDQNNGKRIGINGSWIYHVTTLKEEKEFRGVGFWVDCLTLRYNEGLGRDEKRRV